MSVFFVIGIVMEPCSENQTDQPEADVFKRDVLSELSSTSNLQVWI